jgi:DNA modification methylase
MTVDIRVGDCMTVLDTLEEESVQTCISSPPYYGLRDYGTGKWEGGDPACSHRNETRHQAQGKTSQRVGRANVEHQRGETFTDTCGLCGAVRVDEQIGQERTPEAYVEKLVAVFRRVRRVLRDDGTVWLNLGDSYANDGKWGGETGGLHAYIDDASRQRIGRSKRSTGLKPKDLIGIPWKVAFALQADGWTLRMDVVWHKTQPMPESVEDRPTRAHEYLFLLSKHAHYYYDAEAIAEPATGRASQGTRNKRSVWTINSEPYDGAHFAVMPTALVAPCVLAASRMGDTVLDPFGGSGTVGEVATELGRHAVLIELNPEYARLAEKRCAQQGLFARTQGHRSAPNCDEHPAVLPSSEMHDRLLATDEQRWLLGGGS